MRDYLRRTCDEGWIVNLSPEGQRSDAATRVFPGVAQPLAIFVFVRRAGTERGPEHRARVHYRAVSGKRADKFRQLRAIRVDDDGWRDTHTHPTRPLTPVTESGWEEFPELNDLFPWGSPGSKANRSWVSAPSEEILRRRWATLIRESDPAHQAELFKETRDRTLTGRRDPLPGQFTPRHPLAEERGTTPHLVRMALRSFDRQHLIADDRVLDRPRPDLWAAAQRGGQLFLNQQSSHPIDSGPALVATHLIPDTHHFNGRGGRTMPLLHPDGSANTAAGLLPHLARTLGRARIEAEDLAAYAVAVAGHSAFTRRFTEELLTPGVRLPLTRDGALWDEAVALGRQVLWASTFGARCADPAQDRPVGSPEFPSGDPRRVRYDTHIGDTLPERIRHDAESGTLHVGEGKFAPVPEAVWTYDVGGMPVVKKWFGYRKASPNSKKTSPLDDIHVDTWPSEWTSELIELLSVLRRLTDLAPAQDALLAAVLAGPVVTEDELRAAGVLPVPPSARKSRDPAVDGLFPDD
ncbi:type ISP restriction/modification enzyme [Streptomyces hirsutus]|uniref:type ISP restriction/modification enzyme n=1 Tax=Streptomyces hirsutus TaxID=35620 RepID=UPI0036293918